MSATMKMQLKQPDEELKAGKKILIFNQDFHQMKIGKCQINQWIVMKNNEL